MCILTVICLSAIAIPFLNSKAVVTQPENNSKYVIDLWDTSSVTVKGSEFSVIKTIASEYASAHENVSVNLVKINDNRAGENVRLNEQRGVFPDVMRTVVGDYEALFTRAVSSEDYAQRAAKLYAPWVKPAYGQYVITDYWANASVMLVNEDILSEVGVNFDSDKVSFDSLLSLLSEVTAKGGGKYNALDYPREDIHAYLPFYIDSPEDYPQKLAEYLPKDHSRRSASEALSDFLGGKTAVYCADLFLVNRLIRISAANRGFDYSVMLYPAFAGKLVYIRQFGSYIFYGSGDKAFDDALVNMALYLLSPAAQIYTENLGMIGCGGKDIQYKQYPHLNIFKQENLIWETLRSENSRELYSRLKELNEKGE
ncbi:MAG: extracellular solute-binding protein [Eubacteriaceae bacterium]|nr:extracellular solute-binding protein [Eubacteriaceae bacterium]